VHDGIIELVGVVGRVVLPNIVLDALFFLDALPKKLTGLYKFIFFLLHEATVERPSSILAF